MNLNISDSAAQRIFELASVEPDKNPKLRVYITGGGCSGFQYGYAFEYELKEDDNIFTRQVTDSNGNTGEITVIVDPLSMQYLSNATVNFKKTLRGAHFSITNPNAETTCSCGASFAI